MRYYKNYFVDSIIDFYCDRSFRKKVGELTKAQNFISNYFQHLKADLAPALLIDRCKIEIKVSYVKNGEFIFMQIDNITLRFIRLNNKIEVWSDDLIYDEKEERIFTEPKKIDQIKACSENMEMRLDDILYRAFQEKHIQELTFENY
ncbi:hypothetical protein [Heyndrickxia oleronia]|uniref:hypothetical protein n=1 Tax=Heyndrickxia oleronia TaxID=38875 RepID=UPI00242E5899|nr:hypothetical protein [Heyndrickxia oleronia]MCI1593233.1 hypothetical protein [Heyndrickxia oleronia]MCI1615474.1 hypothetical protein [Heyndrickxia oleronia]MCI1746176.1 hypothetical protein [Heyndrickxia oleronia]MCI1763559.1 hypothetical protein [Heyndrickxia oleronia]